MTTAERELALRQCAQAIKDNDLELVRFVWCDTHGQTRGKTLTRNAALHALTHGVGMVSTLMLKDTSDRTAYKVFEPGMNDTLPGFEFANNLTLHPIAETFHVLPWTEKTGWIQCQPFFGDGRAVTLDSRWQLQRALERLSAKGLQMMCGLEIEFHIYRIHNHTARTDRDPSQAAWPGLAPEVSLIHPGYNLLSEQWFDMSEEPLRIVQRTAQALGLPLISLEIELGPSQVEAVFEPSDALTAADNMVLFRSAVQQALRRAGYHATFMCRPPFEQIMSSGWHLHQSLVDATSGYNVLMRESPAANTHKRDASYSLSTTGSQYLAGLLQHAPGMTLFCTPTINGFGRFRPNALAPQSILWGFDNRGAMLRVIGGPGDAATRIENRLGEPAANPYLYMAAQIHAGLSGMEQAAQPPQGTESPYADGDTVQRIPSNMRDAIDALQTDSAMTTGFGTDFVNHYVRLKLAELQRYEAAQDKDEFQRREYFSRI